MAPRKGGLIVLDGETRVTPWISIDHSGSNGFTGFPGAPDQDISYRFRLTFHDDGQVVLEGPHDGYPSYEA